MIRPLQIQIIQYSPTFLNPGDFQPRIHGGRRQGSWGCIVKAMGQSHEHGAEDALVKAFKRMARFGNEKEQVRALSRIFQLRPSLNQKEEICLAVLNSPETTEENKSFSRTQWQMWRPIENMRRSSASMRRSSGQVKLSWPWKNNDRSDHETGT